MSLRDKQREIEQRSQADENWRRKLRPQEAPPVTTAQQIYEAKTFTRYWYCPSTAHNTWYNAPLYLYKEMHYGQGAANECITVIDFEKSIGWPATKQASLNLFGMPRHFTYLTGSDLGFHFLRAQINCLALTSAQEALASYAALNNLFTQSFEGWGQGVNYKLQYQSMGGGTSSSICTYGQGMGDPWQPPISPYGAFNEPFHGIAIDIPSGIIKFRKIAMKLIVDVAVGLTQRAPGGYWWFGIFAPHLAANSDKRLRANLGIYRFANQYGIIPTDVNKT